MLGTHQEGTECEQGVLRRVFVLPEELLSCLPRAARLWALVLETVAS